ncbi:HoxN/HupN/NixA family nickel/cobalt transporter [Planotetraspora mira]|uniref:Nickel/cobalt efflux system n=1 Tax=Planotetraspora mira TaxID=58121 RepID=A0A8J3TZZ6_9ACTN|nr:hypothetical protein [Planotetraspora mira]GII34951.1 hypothetical protein Pmi06nite_83930 [Planotetraspora mira]
MRLSKTPGLIGTLVSGVFLMIIALINTVVLWQIVKVFRQMRRGAYDEAALEEQLNKRGFMNRILGGAIKAVRKPWHMYPIGLLFGLGFDTATEISLLVLAGGAAAFNLPWYAVLTLPVLFAAGMSLLDSIDGCFMNFAYGWAFAKPVRKIYYNITIPASGRLLCRRLCEHPYPCASGCAARVGRAVGHVCHRDACLGAPLRPSGHGADQRHRIACARRGPPWRAALKA